MGSILKSTNNSALLFALRMGGLGNETAGHTLAWCDRCELNSILAGSQRERVREGRRLSEREHSSCSSGSARKCFQCSKRKQLKHSPLLFCSERRRERHVQLTLLPAGCLPHAASYRLLLLLLPGCYLASRHKCWLTLWHTKMRLHNFINTQN